MMIPIQVYSKHIEFIVQPFGCTVHVFTDSTGYVNYIGVPISENAQCETSEMEDSYVSYIPDSTCLDHEVIHLTWFILSAYGVKIDSDNNEIQAYLFEYIKNEINK